jgi:L-ascorbate metabolism protein UlaG (beta-lactamase superfamily)
VRAEGEPTVFHPGDALDAEPGAVDVLCVPVNAPWAKVSETIGFVRRIAPGHIVPIHDGLLNDRGRNLYLGQVAEHGADGGVEVLDLRDRGRTTVA